MSIERKFDPYKLFNLDKFFDDFLSSPFPFSSETFTYPKVDIRELENTYEIIAEVPGLDKLPLNLKKKPKKKKKIKKEIISIKNGAIEPFRDNSDYLKTPIRIK